MWFLRLVRWPNLVIIILTQVLVRYCVISPLMKSEGMHLQLSAICFVLLVFATVLISAAGYIINDYFDQQIDRINKPERMVIGKHIDGRKAKLLYLILNIIAIILGFFTWNSTGSFKPGMIFPLAAALLWFYSARFKRRLITGNLMVSGLSATVVMIVWLFEYFAISSSGIMLQAQSKIIGFVVGSYAVFAFLVTMVREIVKDIEDMEGDATTGCKTFPLVYGIPPSKNLAISISMLTIMLLAAGQYLMLLQGMKLLFWYYLIPVQVLLISLVLWISRAGAPADFRSPGNLAKAIMIAGTLGMLLFPTSIIN